MRIGYPNHPRRELAEEIAWAGENGFDYLDLFLEADKASLEVVDPDAVRVWLDRFELDVVGHLAWYLPIGSPMPQLRRAAVDVTVEYLRVFARIGAPAVSIHTNWPSRLFTVGEGIWWQIESLREIAAAAKALGLRIMLEPTGSEKDNAGNISTILNALPEILCHLDIGHCNLHGRDPATMIRQFAERLHHLHIHDNNGLADLHLPVGAGIIDWAAVSEALREVGYDRTATVEVFSKDRDYLLLSKRKIEEWAGKR